MFTKIKAVVSPLRDADYDVFKLRRGVYLAHGNSLKLLKRLPDNSIDSCVCDPPYALNFMGKGWDVGDVAFNVKFWKQVLRVLKPGAHLIAFGGTRTYHRLVCAVEDAGFEIRDQFAWLYGSGFPKSLDVSKAIDKHLGMQRGKVRVKPRPATSGTMAGSGDTRPWIEKSREKGYHEVDDNKPASPQAAAWDGWGTAVKPAFEPIVLARKPLSEKNVAANILRWGTGALNIDGCRIEGEPTHGSGVSQSSKNVTAFGDMGAKRVGVPNVVNTEGRWPANVQHDGSDEVVGAFPTTGASKARIGKRSGKETNTFGEFAGQENVAMGHDDPGGSAARFFYSAKASKGDRAGSEHPTIKPVGLMQHYVRLVTPSNGIVLDPFAGSGSTAQAAVMEQARCLLMEMEANHIDDIRERFNRLFTLY